MRNLFESIQQFGLLAIDSFWFPVILWSAAGILVFTTLRLFKGINPLYQYHLRVATLLALPIGILSALGLQSFAQSGSAGTIWEGPVLVVENPIAYAQVTGSAGTELNLNWLEPNFLAGLITAILVAVAVAFLIRLGLSYRELRKLHQNLSKEKLTGVEDQVLAQKQIQIAFHDHPLVPFTFGWTTPVIVVPSALKNDPEKLQMAIQHELTHIRRGDYLLQIMLSVIESAFWFHPLIWIGKKEIETYREISCDQEVLNTSDISPKSYANMLFELVPLKKGFGSFSVSMAVQQSTLKQRIETMRYHKLRKSSLKKSLLFLIGMTLIVIAPIACSDLRTQNSGLSEIELNSMSISFMDPVLTVNGEDIEFPGGQYFQFNREINATSGISIGAHKYGLFVMSTLQFDKAKLAGKIEGNEISFTINQINVRLLNRGKPFIKGETDVWVRHFPNRIPVSFGMGTFPYSKLVDGSYIDGLIPEQTLRSPSTEKEQDYFTVVEQMPQLIGGLAGLQSKVEYPQMAARAGIEGRVTVQFTVNEQGEVENPQVIRGIGGGCDEEALRVVSEAQFKPGYQRGRPVRVQYSLPVVFKLSDSDFTRADNSTKNNEPAIFIKKIESQNGAVEFILTDKDGNPLMGANIYSEALDRGAATNAQGIANMRNLPSGTFKFTISYMGLPTRVQEVTIAQ